MTTRPGDTCTNCGAPRSAHTPAKNGGLDCPPRADGKVPCVVGSEIVDMDYENHCAITRLKIEWRDPPPLPAPDTGDARGEIPCCCVCHDPAYGCAAPRAAPSRAEVERLIDDYGRRCAANGWANEQRRRAALLDYVCGKDGGK